MKILVGNFVAVFLALAIANVQAQEACRCGDMLDCVETRFGDVGEKMKAKMKNKIMRVMNDKSIFPDCDNPQDEHLTKVCAACKDEYDAAKNDIMREAAPIKQCIEDQFDKPEMAEPINNVLTAIRECGENMEKPDKELAIQGCAAGFNPFAMMGGKGGPGGFPGGPPPGFGDGSGGPPPFGGGFGGGGGGGGPPPQILAMLKARFGGGGGSGDSASAGAGGGDFFGNMIEGKVKGKIMAMCKGEEDEEEGDENSFKARMRARFGGGMGGKGPGGKGKCVMKKVKEAKRSLLAKPGNEKIADFYACMKDQKNAFCDDLGQKVDQMKDVCIKQNSCTFGNMIGAKMKMKESMDGGCKEKMMEPMEKIMKSICECVKTRVSDGPSDLCDCAE